MCVATFEPAAIASVATSEWVARAVERKVDRNLRTCTHSLGAPHVTRILPWMWRIVFCTRISCSTYLGTNIFCRHRSNCVEVAPPPRIRAESAAGESFSLAWPSVAPAAKTPLAPVVALPPSRWRASSAPTTPPFRASYPPGEREGPSSLSFSAPARHPPSARMS